MTYYAVINQASGDLDLCTYTYQEPVGGQMVRVFEGDIPDLNIFSWSPANLAFIQKDPSRQISKFDFLNVRLSHEELVAILTAEQTDMNVKAAVKKFEESDYVWLDNPALVYWLDLMELAGILGPGRSAGLRA